jgi:hypothetical protein
MDALAVPVGKMEQGKFPKKRVNYPEATHVGWVNVGAVSFMQRRAALRVKIVTVPLSTTPMAPG